MRIKEESVITSSILVLVTRYSGLSLRTKKARLTELRQKHAVFEIPVEHPNGDVHQTSGH